VSEHDWVARVRSPTRSALRSLLRWIVLKPVSRFFLRIRIRGRRNLDDLRRPMIVVANHSSHWDSVLLHSYLPSALANRLATAAAADHFFSGRRPAIAPRLFFNAFPVARSGRQGRAPRGLALALLAAGTSVLLFPEGTRSRNGHLGPFNPGAAALAIKEGLACLPVRITGTWQAWPAHQGGPRLPRRRVSMIILPAMTPEPDESIRAFNARLHAAIDPEGLVDR
jgi:1-acyl-sn-glycerol-3-phosphate acyltransferase